jgi:hypothetical protein
LDSPLTSPEGDAAIVEERSPGQLRGRRVLTPRRIASVIGPVLLAIRLRRQLRFAREVFKHRRRLTLAFSVLLFLRQLRKG